MDDDDVYCRRLTLTLGVKSTINQNEAPGCRALVIDRIVVGLLSIFSILGNFYFQPKDDIHRWVRYN
jgi:hypothetical protein